MSRFQIEASPNEVRIAGQGARTLLAGFLIRAKFGEAFEEVTLLNGILAEWLKLLAPPDQRASMSDLQLRFGHEFIEGVSTTIFNTSYRNGWFGMTHAEQVAFLKDVVVVPHDIGDADIEAIRECIEGKLFNSRRVVEAADSMQNKR